MSGGHGIERGGVAAGGFPEAGSTPPVVRDVVVIGSGAGGLAAALTAAKEGLSVTVLEKTEFVGGSTAVSGGAVWIPENHHMASVGHTDSREAVLRYLEQTTGNALRRDLITAFLDNGPRMIRFLEENTAVRFVPRAHSPDYYPGLEGASMGGRTLDPKPFDGSELGDWFDRLRPPYPEFLVFGGMMVNRKDIDCLLGTFRSVANFKHALSIIGRYGLDRLRGYRRGTRLLMGNALAGRLLASALACGVDIRLRAAAQALIVEEGCVRGVEARVEGRAVRFKAQRGVILAGGGWPQNPEQRRRFVSHSDVHRSMAPPGNSGDTIRLALDIGGVLENPEAVGPAFWAPVSVMRWPDGREVVFPHLILDRQKPGVIAVNAAGRRFTNEADSYHAFVEAMHRAHAEYPTIPCHLVCDRRFLRKYGLGLVRPGPRSLRPFIASGYLVEASTVPELARKIGVDPEGLVETVERMNRAARAGHDPDFGKGSTEYNWYLGDPNHRPNPCLGPIETPPYYAVRVWPGDIGTALGLKTDAKARVLTAKGAPITGLYAVGNDMSSVMAGRYPGAGITLGPALTFGYIAGRDVSGREDERGEARAVLQSSEEQTVQGATK